MGIKIVGVGSFTPEKVLTNRDLERIVDTSDEWIRTRTGIIERRICEDGQGTVYMGTKAAEKALEMADIEGEDLDLIIFATVTPDKRLPSNACYVQTNLKNKKAVCFDFQAACSGFIYGLEIATAMMKYNRRYKTALVIGGEKLSSVTNWKDRNTCVLFGDAAGAAVLHKTKDNRDSLIVSNLYANGEHADLLEIPEGGSIKKLTYDDIDNGSLCIKMSGNKVFKLAVSAMVKASKEALEMANLTSDEIDWLIPHQANLRIMLAVAERLNINVKRIPINLDKHGNTSSASIILSLDEYVRKGKIKEGDKILLTAFGGGMTWGASILIW